MEGTRGACQLGGQPRSFTTHEELFALWQEAVERIRANVAEALTRGDMGLTVVPANAATWDDLDVDVTAFVEAEFDGPGQEALVRLRGPAVPPTR